MFGRRSWAHPKVGYKVLLDLERAAFQLELPGEFTHLGRRWDVYGNETSEMVVDLVARLYYAIWGTHLAREKKAQQVTWRGFKDVKLTEAQRDAYEAWDAQDADVYELLANGVVAGFKFTVSYNASNDTYTATYTGQGNAPECAKGYSLSAFAPTWYDACRTLAFKHWFVLEGDWSKIEISASDRWG